jgi:ABC-type amino acid transport substrate-binding protein
MMVKSILFLFISMLVQMQSSSFADEIKPYICGLASGYPPYQFKDKDNKIAGLDVDIIRLVFQAAEKQLQLQQMDWDDAIATLRFTPNLDCIAGMEKNSIREKFFDFTSPYYSRKIVIFALRSSHNITKIEDLIGHKITGDKHSSVEFFLEKNNLRKKYGLNQQKAKNYPCVYYKVVNLLP